MKDIILILLVLISPRLLLGQADQTLEVFKKDLTPGDSILLLTNGPFFHKGSARIDETYTELLEQIANYIGDGCHYGLVFHLESDKEDGLIPANVIREMRADSLKKFFKDRGAKEFTIWQASHRISKIGTEQKQFEFLIRRNFGAFDVVDLKNYTNHNKPFEVGDIRFKLGRAALQECSIPQIEKIVEYMEDNPSYVLEIMNHMDCRGSNAACKDMSQRRADSIVYAIVQRGISPERIVPAGYGEQSPRTISEVDPESGDTTTYLLTCDFINTFRGVDSEKYERYHQHNRRTEIRILSKDYVDRSEIINVVDQFKDHRKEFFLHSIRLDDKASQLEQRRANEQIKKIADFMRAFPNYVIQVEQLVGCRELDNDANILSRNLSDTLVYKLVIEHGIAPERLMSIGYSCGPPDFENEEREAEKMEKLMNCSYTQNLKETNYRAYLKYIRRNQRTCIRVISGDYNTACPTEYWQDGERYEYRPKCDSLKNDTMIFKVGRRTEFIILEEKP